MIISNFIMIFVVVTSLSTHSNCDIQSVNLLDYINIKWENQGVSTQFWINANLPSSINPNDAWVGVGINLNDEMVFKILLNYTAFFTCQTKVINVSRVIY